MKGLAVNTRSVVFHDDGSVEIVYHEQNDQKNGVIKTSMLQFASDLYLARTLAFLQDCQDYIDDMLVVLREGAPD